MQDRGRDVVHLGYPLQKVGDAAALALVVIRLSIGRRHPFLHQCSESMHLLV